jgi:hypothetical protein
MFCQGTLWDYTDGCKVLVATDFFEFLVELGVLWGGYGGTGSDDGGGCRGRGWRDYDASRLVSDTQNRRTAAGSSLQTDRQTDRDTSMFR